MATNSITQRIGLDGGDDVKKQLDDLGTAGAAAFQKLQDGAKAASVLDTIAPTLDAISAKAAALGDAFSNVGSKLSAVGSSVESAVTKTALLVGSVTAVVGGFVALVKGAADTQAALSNTAQAVGLTTEQFEQLSFAFEQNGTDQDAFTRGMDRFDNAIDAVSKQGLQFQQKQTAINKAFGDGKISLDQYNTEMSDLQTTSGQTINAFTRLGVSIAKTNDGTVDTDETLKRVADAFQALPDGANKSSLAMQLFGTRNTTFLATLNQGRDGLEQYGKEQQALAPQLSKTAQLAGVALNQAFGKLTTAIGGVKATALSQFFTPLTAVIDAVTQAVVSNRGAFSILASNIANETKPVLLDLINLLEGKDNQITNTWILQARDAIVELGTQTHAAVTNIIIPALGLMLEGLNGIASALNLAFGTNFTGETLAAALVITKLTGLMGVLRTAVSAVISIIELLAAAFGGVEVALVIIGAAVGFFGVKLFQAVGGWQGIWNGFWKAAQVVATATLDAITSLLDTIGGAIEAGFSGVVGGIEAAFTAVGSLVAAVFDAIVQTASQAVASIIAFFVELGTAIGGVFGAFGSAISGAWATLVSGATDAGSAILTAFTTAVTAITTTFTDIPAGIAAVWAAIVAAANGAWAAILGGATALGAAMVAPFTSALASLTQGFSDVKDFVLGVFNAIISAAQTVAQAISSLTGGGGNSTASDGPGFARGGYIRGGGTSTSDSISARLSNGEFVESARAVSKYGADVFHAFNKGLFPVGPIRDLMSGRGFNLGGLAEGLGSIMPRTNFASGGLVAAATGGSSGRSFIVHVGGGMGIGPFTGPDNALDQLERSSNKAAIRAASRKPAWFR
jgi:hypothetical protein